MKQFLRNLALLALLCVPWVTQAQQSLPYTMDFEDETEFGNWTVRDNASSTGRQTAAKRNGSYGFQFYYNTNPPQYLISPELSCPSGVTMEFYYMNGSSYTETFQVGYSTTDNASTSFTWEEEVTAPSSWTLYSTNFPAGTKYVAFKYTANDQFKMYIDDISLLTPPSCVKPTGLAVTLTPGNGTIATLNWTAGATETAWVLEYGTAADFTGATSVDVSGTPSKSLTGLTAEATYYARVKADCGGSEVSDWCNVVTFTPTNTLIIEILGTTSSTSSYLPSQTNYDYSYTQQIYTATEMGGFPCSLQSVAFKGNKSSVCSLDIYLVNTEKSSFSGTSDYIAIDDATLVFSGDVTFTANDWTTITFDNEFDYTGGNLAIIVDDNSGNYDYGSTTWQAFSATAQALHFYQDGTNINPASPSASYSGVDNSKNQVKFTYSISAYPKPKNLAVSGLVYNGATITWIAPSENVVNYSYSYQANGGSWTDDVTTTNLSVALSELTANTAYTFRVKAIYSDGESDYATKSFQTPCALYQIPYTYGFETEGDMTCWSMIDNEVYGYYYNETENEYSRTGNGCFMFSSYSGSTDPQYLISPELTGIENGLHVEFYYRSMQDGESYAETFKVGYSTTTADVSSFTWSNELTSSSGSYNRFSANYPAGVKYVSVQYTSADSYYLFVDDITLEEVASCLEPTGVAAASITTTGASISWVAGGEESAWDIYVTNNNEDVPGETTTPTVAGVTDNPYGLTGLTHSTTYYVYVRAACSSTEKSAWSSPVTFHTECEGMALPYTYGFEDDALSVCWRVITEIPAYLTASIYNNASYAHDGTHSLQFHRGTSSGDLIVVLPEVDENYPLNGYEMNFWNMGTNPIVIGIMTDPTDASTFVAISDAIASTSTYTEHLVRFNTYEGTGRYIAIKNTHSSSGTTFIDDIDVHLLPACMEPSDPTVDNTSITAHTATLNWTGTSDDYNVDYRTKAYFDGISEQFASTPADWFRRQGVLNTDGTATLTGTSSWSTGNSNSVFGGSHAYLNLYSTKNYWLISPSITIGDGFDFSFDIAYTAYSGNNAAPAPNCPTHRFAVLISTDNMATWTILREWNNSGSEYVLDEVSPNGQTVNDIDLSSYANQTAYIAFFAHSETNSYDNNFHLDNVTCGLPIAAGEWHHATATEATVTLTNLAPETLYEAKVQGDCGTDGTSEWSGMVSFTTGIACPAPTTLTAGTPDPDQVQLSWTAGGSETAWDVAYKTGDADFTIIEAVSDNPYTLTGLTPATGYTVKVRANCGGVDGVSAWTSTINFTTALACPAPIITNDSVTPYAHQAVVNWPVFTENTNGYDVNYRTAAYFNGVNEQFASSSAPTGWTMYTGLLSNVMSGTALSPATYGWTFGTGNNVFDSHARDNIYGNYQRWLVTPAIEVAEGFVLNFDLALTVYSSSSSASPAAGGQPDDKFVVLVSGDEMATWTILRQWDNGGSEYVYDEITNTGENVSIDLSAYVGQTVNIAFYGESTTSNGDNNLHIDNVACGLEVPAGAWQTEHVAAGTGTATITGLTPETPYEVNVTGMCAAGAESESDTVTFTTTIPCPAPTTLAATDITTNSVVLSWNETGLATAWKVAYKTVDAEEYTEVDATTNPYTLTGLSAGTAYTVKVKADCGTEDGTSGWSNTVTFTTVCLPITEFPYTENFDSYTSGNNVLPICWNYINTTTNSTYKYYPKIYNSGANSPSNCLRLYSYASYSGGTTTYDPQDQYAILPEMNGLAGMQITLQAKGYNATSTFKVGLMTNPADASTFTVIGDELALTTSYQEFVIDIPTTATAHYVAIMIDAANSTRTTNGVYVDDIRIAEPPTCLKVTDVELVSVTTTSATLSWTNGSTDQEAWQIAYSTDASFDPTAAGVTPVDVNANPGTITGLTPATTYYAYVRANCGSNGFSEWNNTALQFSTACEAFTEFPWSENFEDYAAGIFSDPCWVNERIIDGTGSGTLSVFRVVTTTMGDNTTNKLQLPDMPNGTVTKLRLPEMTFTADQYQFILDVYRNSSQSSKTNEGVRVYISTDGEIEGATELAFIPRVYTVSNDVIPAETATGWYTYKLPFSVTGNYYIVLAGESKYGAATYMDNFVVRVTPKYDVTTSVTMDGEAPMGSVAPEALTDVYENTNVTLTATANYGYRFVNWTEGETALGTNSTLSFILAADRNIVANFELDEFTATAVADDDMGTATVVANPSGEPAASINAVYKSYVTFTATPHTGLHFVKWTTASGYEVSEPTFTVQMLSDTAFTAIFDTNVYNVQVNITNDEVNGGVAMGTVEGPDTIKHFYSGAYVPTANYGYHFVNWTDMAGEVLPITPGMEDTLMIAAVRDTIVNANFTYNTYTVTGVSADSVMGTVSGTDTVNYLETVTLTATNNYGYHFVNWTEGENVIGTENTISVVANADRTITANFTYNQYTVSASSANTVKGTVAPVSSTVNYLTSVTVTATPNVGFHFANWTEADSVLSTNATVDVTALSNRSIVANFDTNIYNVVANVNNAAMGSVQGAAPTKHFESVILTAVANYGYHFVNWTDSLGTVKGSSSQLSVSPMSDTTLYANFTYNQYTVTGNSANTTMGSVAGTSTVNYLENVTLTATANYGYHFTGWSNGATTAQITIQAVKDSTVTASFDYNQYTVTGLSADTTKGAVTGTATVNYLQTVTLTANPVEGYHFVKWNDNNTDNPRYVSATGDLTYTATFAINTYDITLSYDNTRGVVRDAQSNVVTSGTVYQNVEHGTVLSFVAEAYDGSRFGGWSNGTTTESISYTATATATLTASFVDAGNFLVTVTYNDAMGTVTGAGEHHADNDVTLTAAANYGYHFVAWMSGTDTVSYNNTVTFTMPASDVTYIALFDYNQYTVTGVSADTTKGTVAGTATVNYLQNVTLSATNKYGYHFVNWTEADTVLSTNATISVAALSNRTITANFDYNQYTVTGVSADNTKGTVTGTATVNYLQTVTLTAQPGTCYHFVNWSNGETTESIVVTANESMTLTAYFAANVYSSTETVTACDVYTWNGRSYNVGGSYTIDTVNANGCDSTATLVLTLNHSNTSDTLATACDGFSWYDGNHTESGNYPYTFVGANRYGCDSTVTLHLTVNYSNTGDTTAVACNSFTWYGTTYNTTPAVAPTHVFTNVAGCDSTVTLHLTVNHSNTGDTTAVACDGFTWYDGNHTESGNYPYTFVGANRYGCDSTVTLHLTVNYSNTGDTTAVACDGFTWYGTDYNTTPAVAPTHVFTNVAGCDSTVTLHLTVNHSNTGDTTAVACNSFTWYGTTYNTTPAVAPTHVFTNVAGCDSTVTLHLTVNYSNTGDTTAVACNSFTWYGTTYNTTPAVAPTHVFTNVAGCDSTVTLHLTVNYSNTGDTTAVACNSFTWYGTTYNTTPAVAPTHVFTNVAGCDSTVTLHLTINHSNTGDTTAVACNSFTWYGTTYTSTPAVAPTHVFTNVAGCDSTVTLHLTVNHSNTGDTTAVACNSFTWYGTTYNTTPAVAPTHVLTNVAGCDSTVTLHLTINNSQTVVLDPVVACDSYEWNEQTYNQSGQLSYTTTGANGCDSTTTVVLTVNYSTVGDTTAVAYDNFEWHGVVYTETPEVAPTYVTTNAAGCDSTVTLNLTINHYDSITVILTVNDATMGTTDPVAGTYRFYPGETVSATATANEGYRFVGWVASAGDYSDTVSREAEISYELVAEMQGMTFTVEAVFVREDVGIETVDYSNINIFSADNKVFVKGAEGMTIYIYDVNGRCMARRANAAETETFTMDVTGVVLVKAGNAPAKRVLVVR